MVQGRRPGAGGGGARARRPADAMIRASPRAAPRRPRPGLARDRASNWSRSPTTMRPAPRVARGGRARGRRPSRLFVQGQDPAEPGRARRLRPLLAHDLGSRARPALSDLQHRVPELGVRAVDGFDTPRSGASPAARIAISAGARSRQGCGPVFEPEALVHHAVDDVGPLGKLGRGAVDDADGRLRAPPRAPSLDSSSSGSSGRRSTGCCSRPWSARCCRPLACRSRPGCMYPYLRMSGRGGAGGRRAGARSVLRPPRPVEVGAVAPRRISRRGHPCSSRAARRGSYIRSGALTPSSPRVVAIVRLVATQSAEPRGLGAGSLGADHPAVAVEGVEVGGGRHRVGAEPVRRAPLRPPCDLARQLEQPPDQRPLGRLGRRRRAPPRPPPPRRPRVRAAPPSSAALRRMLAIRACAYWT